MGSTSAVFETPDHVLLVRRGQITSSVKLQVWKFTGIGLEMLPLLPAHLDDGYIEKIAKLYTSRKGDVTLGKIKQRLPDGRISFEIVRKFEVEQDGADQPATAPASEPQGDDKPEPESEVRPQ